MQLEPKGGQKVGLVLEGGGVLGAYTDGVLDVLLPKVDVEYVIGTSAGAKSGATIVWAQHQARQTLGTVPSDIDTTMQRRRATASFYTQASNQIWKNVCTTTRFVENATMLLSLWPDSIKDMMAMQAWRVQSDWAEQAGDRCNPLLNLLDASLPGLRSALRDPDTAWLATNAVNVNTGEHRITRTRDECGRVLEADHLAMIAASGAVPPEIPLLRGGWADGALYLNGPVAGVVPDHSDTPIIRIALGKPDFTSRFCDDARLHALARAAFDRATEPLPTDRPTFEFSYPQLNLDRTKTAWPTCETVAAGRRLGRLDAETALANGLLEQLSRPVQAAQKQPPLALAA